MYKLFVDDDARTPDLEDFRYPPQEDNDWKIATSSAEAMTIVCEFGFPEFMSLDCDLGLLNDGSPDSAMLFIKWLYDKYPDWEPNWTIHSLNGEAAKNLQSFLLGWKRSL